MEGFLTVLGVAFAAIFSAILVALHVRKPGDAIVEPMEPTPTTPPEPINLPVTESNREKLYRVSKACIGRDMSPKDLAPDQLACVDSLNGVFTEAFGQPIKPGIVSTIELYHLMLNDPRFQKIGEPDVLPGDVSIAVSVQTGTSVKHGHVGIWGKTEVMSNDSYSLPAGLWHAHYTLEAWKNFFWGTLHFPLHYFRVV